MAVLITGGSGFIGSNFVRYHLLRHPGVTIVNLDKLTYAGNPENLRDVENRPEYRFVEGDICNRETVSTLLKKYGVTVIFNFAAESHVDRSIVGPAVFIETNIGGTSVLLECAREHGVQKFIQISTDEVYGTLGAEGMFTESTQLHPNSPYSASKAAADLLALAYHETYGLPVVITRCSNNYGPYQFPEKLIPLMIANALEDKPLPVYGDGLHVRDWLHVDDHCSALDAAASRGGPGQIYNIGGNCEQSNLETVKTILRILGKPERLITFVKDRPGHDRRYAIDATKIARECGWKPAITFREGLEAAVRWYVANESWRKRVMSGEYREYYRKMYEER